MYSTCLFCHGHLGSNQMVERFPVGGRLAFDGARGRLWVVCAHCGRWNLSPLEERWEALDACERLFRGTRQRVATENIGLARVADGTDLIRVGRPLRPEFAGWRYGRALVQRHRQDLRTAWKIVGGVGAAAVAVPLLGFVSPLAAIGAPVVGAGGIVAGFRLAARRVVARADDPEGVTRVIRVKHLRDVAFRDGVDGDGFAVSLAADGGRVTVAGAAAASLAAVVCARRNQVGGTEQQVGDAVRFLEERGGPDGVLGHVGARGAFNGLRYRERLALEISLHEELERRALEGELRLLENAWREAEEIAAIADGLLLPSAVAAWLRRARPEATELP
jgi:hypothetical protein